MAKKQEQSQAYDASLLKAPDDFREISGGGRVSGWFAIQAGNAVRGLLKGYFDVESRFKNKDGSNKKRVYRIELTSDNPANQGATLVRDPDAESDEAEPIPAKTGQTIGLDEKGFLQCLREVSEGSEVWIACLGKDPPSADYPQGAWKFTVRVAKQAG
jgi:hypothetical protein